jgi:tetratricopeptide (TPR) repeat protein
MKKPGKIQVSKIASMESPQHGIEREFVRVGELNRAGRRDEARAAAKSLYASHPNDATANFLIALLLDENNQKGDALQFAKAAVKLAPNNVRNLVFLGKLYVDLDMIEFAPAILHRAFELDKTVYQAPRALANYHYSSGQGNRALPYFDMALKAAPAGARDEIRLARATCLQAIGRIEEAGEEYDHLATVPEYRIRALTAGALLKKNDQSSDYAVKIRKELEVPGLAPKDRSALLLSLGRLHENGKDYDNAYMNFETSRKLLKSDFNPARFAAIVNDSMNVMKGEVFERFSGFGDLADKPIFIVGMPRSGTTLTEQIIASHSEVEGVGELVRLSRMAANFSARHGMQEVLDRMIEVGPQQWKEVPLQYLNLLNALAPGARRTADKLPHNFLCLGFIHLCFPNAKIIHCKRNPLDSFISAFQNDMAPYHDYSHDQVVYGEYYVKYLQLMEHWKVAFPASIHELQYEKLTANPESEVRSMLEFLGLPWEDACLKFNERESMVKTFSWLQVRDPINTRSVARWRSYEKHLTPIMAVLQNAGVDF